MEISSGKSRSPKYLLVPTIYWFICIHPISFHFYFNTYFYPYYPKVVFYIFHSRLLFLYLSAFQWRTGNSGSAVIKSSSFIQKTGTKFLIQGEIIITAQTKVDFYIKSGWILLWFQFDFFKINFCIFVYYTLKRKICAKFI